MRLRGVGGGASCAGGDGVGGVERNSEGLGGVRVFSGGVNDGRGGRRWERWGLEKERVVGFGGDESGGVLFFGGEFWGVNN